MSIIFLEFGPDRSQAARWMARHVQWIEQGNDELLARGRTPSATA